MKHEAEIRADLVKNTIRMIGEGGFEKATTRAVVRVHDQEPRPYKLNEAHIYRVFGSQEKLYEAAFTTLEEELFAVVRESFAELIAHENADGKTRLRILFRRIWELLLRDENRCRCYVRYYYSVYFAGDSLRAHRKLLAGCRDLFAVMFKEESDVVSLMHTTFMTLIDFAVRVYNRDLLDNEENIYHIYLLVYTSLTPYLKPEYL